VEWHWQREIASSLFARGSDEGSSSADVCQLRVGVIPSAEHANIGDSEREKFLQQSKDSRDRTHNRESP